MELQKGAGRPSKRTPAIEKIILDALAAGLPYRAAAGRAGIHETTLIEWRKNDPDFELAVEKANSVAISRNMQIIQDAAADNWAAGAWILERRFPALFGRPEAQVSLNQQINLSAENVDIHNLIRENAEPLRALLHGDRLPLPDEDAP
jgi:transposase